MITEAADTPVRTHPTQPGLVLAPPPAGSADRSPVSRWPWALQALACPALLAIAIFTPALGALVPGSERVNEPSFPVVLAVVVSVVLHCLTTLVAVVGVAVLLRLHGRRRLRDVEWRLERRGLVMLALGMLVSVVVVAGVGLPLSLDGALRTEDLGIDDVPVGAVIAIGLSQAFLLQAVPEELIFRGYLLGSLRMRPLFAVLTSGLVFAVLHLASSGGQQGWGERVAYLAMPAGFGFGAGALALLTRSLWVAVGVHGGLHTTLLVFTVLERSDPSLAMGNGPALWLLTGLGWTLVAVVALVALARRRSGTPAGTVPGPTSR